MQVLLVNANLKADLLAAPPIGVCYVASAAERAGHTTKVLDLCFAGRESLGRLTRTVREFSPDVIGVSIRNIDNCNLLYPVSYLPPVQAMVETIRRNSRAPLVLGGSGVSLMPEAVLRRLQADFVVVGEGEKTLVSLLECLQAGGNPATIRGVGMLKDGRFHLVPAQYDAMSPESPDLGRWIDTAPYHRLGGSYNVQSKRGCTRHCIYCAYNRALEGSEPRLRRPVDVVDEIEEALARYHPPGFEFVDSVFNSPLDHSRAVLEEIARRPWKTELTAMGVHPEGLDREYLDLMWKAGFRSFMITPESASDEMLRNYGKGFMRDTVIRAAEAVKQTRFAAWWFFMIGGPGENMETLCESLDFVRRHMGTGTAVQIACLFLGVRIYPSTGLWHTAVAENRIQENADPLQGLWYLSHSLDLDEAVRRIYEAAAGSPSLYLGLDEDILGISRLVAFACRMLRARRPYWRYFPLRNVLAMKSGLRLAPRPRDLADQIRSALRRQHDERASGALRS
jgi:anaerobic magnesium-protoporphyrin IX monomethyl ester cyclase